MVLVIFHHLAGHRIHLVHTGITGDGRGRYPDVVGCRIVKVVQHGDLTVDAGDAGGGNVADGDGGGGPEGILLGPARVLDAHQRNGDVEGAVLVVTAANGLRQCADAVSVAAVLESGMYGNALGGGALGDAAADHPAVGVDQFALELEVALGCGAGVVAGRCKHLARGDGSGDLLAFFDRKGELHTRHRAPVGELDLVLGGNLGALGLARSQGIGGRHGDIEFVVVVGGDIHAAGGDLRIRPHQGPGGGRCLAPAHGETGGELVEEGQPGLFRGTGGPVRLFGGDADEFFGRNGHVLGHGIGDVGLEDEGAAGVDHRRALDDGVGLSVAAGIAAAERGRHPQQGRRGGQAGRGNRQGLHRDVPGRIDAGIPDGDVAGGRRRKPLEGDGGQAVQRREKAGQLRGLPQAFDGFVDQHLLAQSAVSDLAHLLAELIEHHQRIALPLGVHLLDGNAEGPVFILQNRWRRRG